MKMTRVTNGSGLTKIARAARSRVSGSSSALSNGTLVRSVPKASSAIDHRHLSEEPALAVTYDDHIIEGWVLAIGIDVLADG